MLGVDDLEGGDLRQRKGAGSEPDGASWLNSGEASSKSTLRAQRCSRFGWRFAAGDRNRERSQTGRDGVAADAPTPKSTLRAQRCSRFGWRFESGSPCHGNPTRASAALATLGKHPKSGVWSRNFTTSLCRRRWFSSGAIVALQRIGHLAVAQLVQDLARLGIGGGVELGRLSCGQTMDEAATADMIRRMMCIRSWSRVERLAESRPRAGARDRASTPQKPAGRSTSAAPSRSSATGAICASASPRCSGLLYADHFPYRQMASARGVRRSPLHAAPSTLTSSMAPIAPPTIPWWGASRTTKFQLYCGDRRGWLPRPRW